MENNQVSAVLLKDLSGLENKTCPVGKVLMLTGGVASGTVFQSKHDRVSEIHASGGMSTSTSVSMYQGTGSMRSSSSFSFEIHSAINTRHEFWVKTDGPDVQFVFFTHIPVADGHEISILPVCYEGGGESFVLGFLLQNRSSNRNCFYAVRGKKANTLIDNVSVHAIAELVEDRFLADAFGTLEDCVKDDPEAKATLLKVYQEFKKAPGTAYWTFELVTIGVAALLGWFASGGNGLMQRLLVTAFCSVLGGLVVQLVGKVTRAEKNSNNSLKNLEEGKVRVGYCH